MNLSIIIQVLTILGVIISLFKMWTSLVVKLKEYEAKVALKQSEMEIRLNQVIKEMGTIKAEGEEEIRSLKTEQSSSIKEIKQILTDNLKELKETNREDHRLMFQSINTTAQAVAGIASAFEMHCKQTG